MKQRIRKLFSLVLAAALLLGVLPVQAFALAPMSYWENTYVYGPYRIYSEKPLYETTIFGKVIDRDVDFSGNTLYINTGTKIWITMDNHNAYVGSPIVVEHNANLEFDELDIRPEASGKAALTVKSGKTLNLGLTGTSKLNGNAASAVVNNGKINLTGQSLTLRGGEGGYGINGGTLTVDIDGKLYAYGGNGGSGINSDLTVKTGTVNAIAGTDGAGIGGGSGQDSKNVTILGGLVEAYGSGGGAGIGGGKGAGIGSRASVRILGGLVTVKGGSTGADIGAGEGGSTAAAIVISDRTSVKPEKRELSVVPVNEDGTPVYLNVIKNEGARTILIDGQAYPYRSHNGETNVYAFLPAGAETSYQDDVLLEGGMRIEPLCPDFDFSKLSYDTDKKQLIVRTDQPFAVSNRSGSPRPIKDSIYVPADQDAEIHFKDVLQIEDPTAGSAFTVGFGSKGNVTIVLETGVSAYLGGADGNPGIRKDCFGSDRGDVGMLTITGTGDLSIAGGKGAGGLGGDPAGSPDVAGITLEGGHITIESDGSDHALAGIGGHPGYGFTERVIIYPEASVSIEGEPKIACTPTNRAGEPVYLLSFSNPTHESFTLDGNQMSLTNHLGEENIYMYIPGVDHSITTAGGKTTCYRFDAAAKTFVEYTPEDPYDTGDLVVEGGTPGADYTYKDGVLSILTRTPLMISNADPDTPTEDRILVNSMARADITLKDVNIDVSGLAAGTAAFSVADGGWQDVTVRLADGSENTLVSADNAAGLQKNGDSSTGTLTLTGSGVLNAQGGSGAAGIGGAAGKTTANIVIEDGILRAAGGTQAPGLGAGKGRSASDLLIRGGVLTVSGSDPDCEDLFISPLASVKGISDCDVWYYLENCAALCELHVIENPTGGPVSINGSELPMRGHDGEPRLYVYLANGHYEIETESGTEEIDVYASTGDFIVTGCSYSEVNYKDGVLSIYTSSPVTIENKDKSKATPHRIFIPTGVDADITLNGVNIDSPQAAIEMELNSGADVSITLAEGSTNTLKAGAMCAAIMKNGEGRTPAGTLTIKGSGKLTAEGGDYAAGIGAGVYITKGRVNNPNYGLLDDQDCHTSYDLGGLIIEGGDIRAAAGAGITAAIGCGGGSAYELGIKFAALCEVTVLGGTILMTDPAADHDIGGTCGGLGGMNVRDLKISILGGSLETSRPGIDLIEGGYLDSEIIIGPDASVKMDYISSSWSDGRGAIDGDGESVYALTVENPDGQPVCINGRQHPLTVHRPEDKALYLFLPAVGIEDPYQICTGRGIKYLYYDDGWKEVPQSGFTISGLQSVYNGHPQTLAAITGTLNEGDLLFGTTEGGINSTQIPAAKTAGAYSVWYRPAGSTGEGPRYSVSSVIEKAPLNVTANDLTVPYGSEPTNGGITCTGLVSGDDESVPGGTLTYPCSYERYDPVGDYSIQPAGLTSDDYEITFTNGTLTVAQRGLLPEDLLVSGSGIVYYDGQVHTASVETAEGLTGAGELSVLYTTDGQTFTDAPADKGVYHIYVSNTGGANITASAGNGIDSGYTLTITDKPVQQPIAFQSTGSSIYAAEYMGSGAKEYVNPLTNANECASVRYSSDAPEVAEVNASTGAVTVKAVGTARITVVSELEGTEPVSASYELSVRKKPVTVTACSKTLTYGDPISASVVGAEVSGVPEGAPALDLSTLTMNGLDNGNVGEYSVMPGGLSSDLYVIRYQAGTLTIVPRILTEENFIVRAESKLYDGTADAELAAEVTGLCGTDELSASVSGSFEDARAGSGKAVRYTINSISGASAGNYSLPAPIEGTVYADIRTGAQDELIIQGKPGNVCYGDSFTLSAEGGSGDGEIRWSSDHDAVTVDPQTGEVTIGGAVGETVTITASKAADANHEAVSVRWTFVPAPRTVSFTLSGLRQTADGQPKAVTVVPSEDGAAYTVTYNDSQTVPAEPGTYTVKVSGTGNYTGTATGTLTIKSKTPGGGGGGGGSSDPVTPPVDPPVGPVVPPVGRVRPPFAPPFGPDGPLPPGQVRADNCHKDDSCVLTAYEDLQPSAWYHDAVHYCVESGLMQGMSETVFDPDGITTRAQLVTILYRLEGQPAFMNDNLFRDVKAGSWYEKAVVWAQGKGIVEGYGDGTFGPDDPITREQMVTILYRYEQYKEADVEVRADEQIPAFPDMEQTSGYAGPAMRWAVARGLLEGSSGRLKPQDSAKRVQTATVLYRYCVMIQDRYPQADQ